MRFLLIFSLIFQIQLILGDLGNQPENKQTCPSWFEKRNLKHQWDVSKFSGLWNGVEMFSHNQHNSLNDTCMRLNVMEISNDGFSESMTRFRLQFSYETYTAIYYASIDPMNPTYWKGDEIAAKVVHSKDDTLALIICEIQTSYLYTIFLQKNYEDEIFSTTKNAALIDRILEFRQLRVYSTANLHTNCSMEDESERIVNYVEASAATNAISLIFLLTFEICFFKFFLF
ncbi:CLUMA_CG010814, isoform A [Clunio marinus]|uniref:CLUMA_CG010814, isoform A n=1 Tax=Clunio marinus TaxID=568069 RepID=A0A1J1IG52_9DIPT|nr:CLUMA_CG010814, isoform A [Clunio marinus]